MPSIRSFVETCKQVFSQASLGIGVSDKISLGLSYSLNLVPRRLRHRLNRIITCLKHLLIRHVWVEIEGVKYFLIDAACLVLTSNYEPHVWKHLNVQANQVFWDVGAHIGRYALHMAQVEGCKVYAFEPNPQNFMALQAGIEANNLSNVTAFNMAAWNSETTLDLNWGVHSGTHSIKKNVGRGSVRVSAKPLDDLLRRGQVDPPDWIKIDVEGVEEEVIEGLRETIVKYRPRIIFESWAYPDKIIEYLTEQGYDCQAISPENYFAYPTERPLL